MGNKVELPILFALGILWAIVQSPVILLLGVGVAVAFPLFRLYNND